MGRVAVYFEAAVVIISLTLLGQLLELKARSQTSAAIKSLLGLAPKTARRIKRRRQRGGRPALPRARRRFAARPARREGAGGRRGDRGHERGRRIDAHRRAAAGEQAPGRQADRRHAQHQRRAGHALRARRRADDARADRADGRAGAALARRRCSAWPTSVAGWFVLVVVAIALATFFAWGLLRSRAELGLRPGQRGGGADHRVSLRARAGHADVDHGGHRQGGDRRACCSATPPRSSACARSTR